MVMLKIILILIITVIQDTTIITTRTIIINLIITTTTSHQCRMDQTCQSMLFLFNDTRHLFVTLVFHLQTLRALIARQQVPRAPRHVKFNLSDIDGDAGGNATIISRLLL
jgi:hypothetical protein